MSEKWTPGPWKADNDLVISLDEDTIDNVVCESPTHALESYNRWEANRALIAAAPALYEALKLAEKALGISDDFVPLGPAVEVAPIIRAALRLAREGE